MTIYHAPVLCLQRWQSWAALLLCAVAFGLAGLVSRTVFERLPHLEDEVAYLFQAQVFAGGQFMLASPPHHRAFSHPFVIDYNRNGEMTRFSKYTPGWSLILAVGVVLGQAWWVNAALAALAVALTYRLAATVFNADVALIAAFLLTFSPAALLLNGSLMAHSAALMLALGFLWAVWQVEHSAHRWRWAALGGVLLGVMLITRPAPTVAVSLPVIVWLGGRALLRLEAAGTLRARVQRAAAYLLPYVLLAALTLSLQTVSHAYNYAATGDASTNLYTLVWPYDRIGFGECCGRNGHTLEKAVRHVRFDMSLAAADLFGWQVNGWQGQALPPDLRDHLLNQGDYWTPIGLSFLLLPFGVMVGLLWRGKRPRWEMVGLVLVWAAGMVAWAVLPVVRLPLSVVQHPISSWLWIIGGLLLVLLPMLAVARRPQPAVQFTWLMVSCIGCIIIFQMTYWVGAQRYSTRYWYEVISMACILTALPIAALMRTRWRRVALYAGVLGITAYAYWNYSVPRVSVLYGFNFISRDPIDELNAIRDPHRPVLVLVTGPATGDNRVSWRASAALAALTSPYLDSDIVVARIPDGDDARRAGVLAMFPERQVIELRASRHTGEFIRPVDPPSR